MKNCCIELKKLNKKYACRVCGKEAKNYELSFIDERCNANCTTLCKQCLKTLSHLINKTLENDKTYGIVVTDKCPLIKEGSRVIVVDEKPNEYIIKPDLGFECLGTYVPKEWVRIEE